MCSGSTPAPGNLVIGCWTVRATSFRLPFFPGPAAPDVPFNSRWAGLRPSADIREAIRRTYMSPRIVHLAMFALVVIGGVETAFADSLYSFTTIDVPRLTFPFTSAGGINDSGQIVGSFYSARDVAHGYFLDVDGSFTTIDAPGASLTIAGGINNSGQIVGWFMDASGNSHGFLYSDGSFTTIDVPGALGTAVFGINDSGQIVGSFGDATGPHGFFLDVDGTFTTIDVPGASVSSPLGINSSGQIVGYYSRTPGTHNIEHGYFLDVDGSFTTIDAPGAIFTSAGGINNSGQIVGSFYGAGDDLHGFLATPVPEPRVVGAGDFNG